MGYGAHQHADDRPADEEMRAYLRRLVVAVAFTIPVLILSFGVPDERWAMWVTWALATPVVFYAGWPFFRSAVRAARHGTTTMDTLVALGAGGRVRLQRVRDGRRVRTGHYFDTAAVIVTLILVGKTLEARARVSAGDAARTLLERGAKEATVLADGVERRVPIDDAASGERRRGPSRREDPRRRGRQGGHVLGGPLDAHRRVGARRRGPWERGRRRLDQRSRPAGRLRHEGRREHEARPRSCGSWSRRRGRRRPSSGSPTASRRSSSRS